MQIHKQQYDMWCLKNWIHGIRHVLYCSVFYLEIDGNTYATSWEWILFSDKLILKTAHLPRHKVVILVKVKIRLYKLPVFETVIWVSFELWLGFHQWNLGTASEVRFCDHPAWTDSLLDVATIGYQVTCYTAFQSWLSKIWVGRYVKNCRLEWWYKKKTQNHQLGKSHTWWLLCTMMHHELQGWDQADWLGLMLLSVRRLCMVVPYIIS